MRTTADLITDSITDHHIYLQWAREALDDGRPDVERMYVAQAAFVRPISHFLLSRMIEETEHERA